MLLEIAAIVISSVFLVVYLVAVKNKREKIDLHGKHVVITGGSSGIGWELAIESFKQGAHVSVIARNQERLNSIKFKLESIKNQDETRKSQIIQIESLDLARSFEETKKVFDKLVENAGSVDILINNAGIFKCVEFTQTKIEDFENMMKVNYLGSIYCTKAVVESMKKRRFGRIVFVSSQAGQIGVYGYTAYSPTKFALKGLAECLQMELKPYNIYVTLAYPPDTDTPGLKEENLHKPEETRLISDTSGVISASEVANHIILKLKKGSFNCSFGLTGFLLETLTVGAGPITTFKEGIIQLFALPLTRLVALLLTFNFDSIVKSCHKKKSK